MTAFLERLIFGNRRLIIVLFAIATVYMAWVAATGLHIDAGFKKLLPLKHEYMQTYLKHGEEFGGANRVLIALIAKDGDMFTPEFFEDLRIATDEVFFIPGVNRATVTSLWTPNTRYTQVVEDGIEGDNVIPADFQPTEEGLEAVRKNILKAGIVGRLVANDFSGAIVSAQLLEINPDTGELLDYAAVSKILEEKIRNRLTNGNTQVSIDVHMLGFVKIIGDITEGAGRVVIFFLIAFFITAVLVYLYTQSFKLTALPLICSVTAVIWQLGLLTLLGFGIDPMGILVPFLVFAIGVSHGVQMVSASRAEVFDGLDSEQAARASFKKLLAPGGIALASDTIGFITILLIEIRVIQEMAITASLGVAVIILTNLVLLPILLSFVHYDDTYRQKLMTRAKLLNQLWERLSYVADRRNATLIVVIAGILAAFGAWKGADIKIGDLHRGVPELRANSRYNVDSEVISNKFSIGVDIITVIVETIPNGCVDYEVMTGIDDFAWHMKNVDGVQNAIALPGIAKIISAGWNEGNMKWRVLSRNPAILQQATAYVETSTGLLNRDCSVMPVLMFTTDHKAETINRVVSEVKAYREAHATDKVDFFLATGNVGVMAATNEEVSAAQFPILLGVFTAVILMCWLTFRLFRSVVCIVVPLAIVSMLAYALMTILEIGLKVSTLPVVALGVGIGVDYGIYIFSRFRSVINDEGLPLREAYFKTLRITGVGVVFTGITLAIGVATWMFSPLKFQADMGVLLTFMFLVNMLGAILLLPALAYWLFPSYRDKTG